MPGKESSQGAAAKATVAGRRRPPRAVVLLTGLTLCGLLVGVAHAPGRPYVIVALYPMLDLVGAIYGFRAARRSAESAWLYFAAGRAVSVLMFITALFVAVNGGQALWWSSIVLRLAVYVLLFVGVVVTPASRLRGRPLAAYLAETLTVLAGGFMFAWYFAIGPVMHHHPPSHLWMASIGNPLGDLLLLIAVATLLLRGMAARLFDPAGMLTVGLTVYLVSDIVWTSLGVHGNQAVDSAPAMIGLISANLLLTLAPMLVGPGTPAAAEPEEREPAGAAKSLARSAHLLPALALTLGCGLLLVATFEEHDMFPWGGLILGLIAMAAAIAVRQLLSLRESRDLIVSDLLTGLANRAGLDAELGRTLRRQSPAAVLLIDLDGFKLVNDAYGHDAGDRVLTHFADLLRGALRRNDLPARIGGDEFAVVAADVATPDQAGTVAERILAAMADRPLEIGEDLVPVRASVGVAIRQPDDTPKELLRRADVAMYEAKRAGTHGFTLHEHWMTDRRAEDVALADDLELALARNQISVLYQPLVDLRTGAPTGIEALARWHHPTRGAVSPVQFIPIAERTGVIAALGLHVLENACRQMRALQAHLPSGARPYVSVNLSPRQLQEPTLVHDVLRILEATGTDPHSLVLEITESAIVDQHLGIPTLEALRSHGIRIAVDDFGTGYSSLHYLTRLPIDILKIDRSFIAELNGTPEGSAITEAVIRLGQALHLRTIAEGIETTAQVEELLQLGCHLGQGFLFAKPMPAQALREMFALAHP